MLPLPLLALGVCALGAAGARAAFDMTRNDNVAVYWGQDSEGSQQTLSYYCQDSSIDTIPLAFLYVFFGPGNEPVVDFANICNEFDNSTFTGTQLANCSFLATDIEFCQSKGKAVTLSLGGATGAVGFDNETQAEDFADQIWNLFLGGSSDVRPFGSAVLDGLDLDIEGGSPNFYADFVNRIRQHESGAKKTYYITAAPQCPFPDANIGPAISSASFDAVYVQFYNNYCELTAPDQFNFDVWDNWAKTQSPNPNVKVYIGAPASSKAAGSGYVNIVTLSDYATTVQQNYSSFGGVMLWDASEAYTNNRYDRAIKQALTEAPVLNPGSSPAPTTTHNECDVIFFTETKNQFRLASNIGLMFRETRRIMSQITSLVGGSVSTVTKRDVLPRIQKYRLIRRFTSEM